MEYKRLYEEELEAARKEGDIEEAMDLVEERITENLLDVRNSFAEEPSDDPDAAFGYLYEISDTILEYQDILEEFRDLGEELEEIKLDREISAEYNIKEDYMRRYVALEHKVESAMMKLDDDFIFQELCRTTKEKIGDLRLFFFGLWLDKTVASRQIDKVFFNYVRQARYGDPAVNIETIRAKLRAIQERASSSHAANFGETETILQDLLSILAAMEKVFRANDCCMELLENALSEYALYNGNWRQTDMKSIHYDLLEGDAMQQMKSLMDRVWERIEKLNNMVEGIIVSVLGQERIES